MATEADKVNTGALATLVAVGTFAMIGISLALVALVRDELSAEVSEKDVAADTQYRSLRAAQVEKLNAGTSITAAMQSVVRDLSANPLAATPESTPPVPMGGAGGASAAGVSPAVATGAMAGAGGTTAGGASGAATAPSAAPGKPTDTKGGKLPAGSGAPATLPGPNQPPGKAPGPSPKAPVPPGTGSPPPPPTSHGI